MRQRYCWLMKDSVPCLHGLIWLKELPLPLRIPWTLNQGKTGRDGNDLLQFVGKNIIMKDTCSPLMPRVKPGFVHQLGLIPADGFMQSLLKNNFNLLARFSDVQCNAV